MIESHGGERQQGRQISKILSGPRAGNQVRSQVLPVGQPERLIKLAEFLSHQGDRVILSKPPVIAACLKATAGLCPTPYADAAKEDFWASPLGWATAIPEFRGLGLKLKWIPPKSTSTKIYAFLIFEKLLNLKAATAFFEITEIATKILFGRTTSNRDIITKLYDLAYGAIHQVEKEQEHV